MSAYKNLIREWLRNETTEFHAFMVPGFAPPNSYRPTKGRTFRASADRSYALCFATGETVSRDLTENVVDRVAVWLRVDVVKTLRLPVIWPVGPTRST